MGAEEGEEGRGEGGERKGSEGSWGRRRRKKEEREGRRRRVKFLLSRAKLHTPQCLYGFPISHMWLYLHSYI